MNGQRGDFNKQQMLIAMSIGVNLVYGIAWPVKDGT